MLRGVAGLPGGDLHGGEGAGAGGAPHLHGRASADAREAVQRVPDVNPGRLPPHLGERRARFLIDVARSHAQVQDDAAATGALTEAEHIAAEELRNHRLTRQVVRDLLTRERRSSALICGDFNTAASSWPRGDKPVVVSPAKLTYPADAPAEPIDYCLASAAFRLDAEVLPGPGSDHLPLRISARQTR